MLQVIAVIDVHLDAAWIAYPSVYESGAFENRSKKLYFLVKVSVVHFQPCIPMGEVAIKTYVRKAATRLNGSPHVLKNCRPVSFGIERDIMLN